MRRASVFASSAAGYDFNFSCSSSTRPANTFVARQESAGLLEQILLLGGRRLLGAFDARRRPLDHHLAELAACTDYINAARLLGDERLERLLGFVELRFAEDEVRLGPRSLHERHALLIRDRLLECRWDRRILASCFEVFEGDIEILPLAQSVEKRLGRLARRSRQRTEQQRRGRHENDSPHQIELPHEQASPTEHR
jgi:hypothetical protein